MVSKPLEIIAGTWSYDKFFDGAEMERLDNLRKQGNMEIKYTLGNGVSKVGSVGKTDYTFTEPRHYTK